MRTKYVVYFTSDYEEENNPVYKTESGDDAHRVARKLNTETKKGITILKVNADGYETAMAYSTGESDTPRTRCGILKEWTFQPKKEKEKPATHRYCASRTKNNPI